MDKIEPKVISFLIYITREDVLHIALAIIILIPLMVYALNKHGNVDKLFDLTLFSTILIEAMIVGIVSMLHTKLLNHTEDPQKLTNDYSKLVKRYASEDRFVWKRNQDGVAIIPVILEQWIFDKKLAIDDHPNSRYTLPSEIIVYYHDLFSAHLTSKIYNNTNIRVDNWYFNSKENRFTIESGRTTYYSSLVTNRAIDFPIRQGISVRELLECGPFVHPLQFSTLSNHLGFNGFVVSKDEVMFVFRKKNVSIGKRTWGDSIGASLKTKYALDRDYNFTLDGLQKGIELEIVDELGISFESLTLPDPKYHEGALGPIRLLAAYRDMLEGGKPQLLFYTRTKMTKDQINTIFKGLAINHQTTHKKYDRVENETEMETDGDILYWINLDDLKRATVKSDRIVCDGITLAMVPSASACVAMFIMYLNHINNSNPSGDSVDSINTLIPYSMRVSKQSIIGKFEDINLCEDAVFTGDRFVAVIDGITENKNDTINGKTTGRRTVEVLLEAFSRLELKKEKDISTEIQIVNFLNNALKKEMDYLTSISYPIDSLCASVIYFDRKKKIVVSYGNCNCRIGSELHYHFNKIDRDFPVLNGRDINENSIKIYEVFEGQRIILCSDGYPYICNTFEESEEKLKSLLEKDPLLIGEFKSKRGMESGARSFDDRTWVEIW